VRYYDLDTSQQRVTFANYDSAKKFASEAVRELAKHRTKFVTLRGREGQEYHEAVELLRPTGFSVLEAAKTWSKAISC
jgi:hypothetical protein